MFARSAAFAIGVLLCSTASAQSYVDDQPPATERVVFSDLNLNSAAGQKILRHRIHLAVSDICASRMEDVAISRACYSAAYWDGLRQMDQLMTARSAGVATAAGAIVIMAK